MSSLPQSGLSAKGRFEGCGSARELSRAFLFSHGKIFCLENKPSTGVNNVDGR